MVRTPTPPKATELQRYSGPNHTANGRSSPYPLSRLAAPISLVDTAREIEAASQSLAHQTNAQLRLIAEQMQNLQQQAERIIERTKADLELHQAHCQFTKVPGQTYHLYEHPIRGKYFSRLSPADYRGAVPQPYIGSYRPEFDSSWTQVFTSEQGED